MALEIISATTIEECQPIESLQHKIWQTSPTDIVPTHMLLTFAKNGGVVLLASRKGEPLGFAFGFPGITATGMLKHCSHQAGVLPGAQNEGIGYQLKLAQRKAVLAQNIQVMTWTFDPLQSRNAYFNMRKLGAVSQLYFRELYGAMRDGLNAGLASDRLEAEWQLGSEPVAQRLAGQSPLPKLDPALVLNTGITDARGFPHPPEKNHEFSARRHFLRIPADINALKSGDMPLAIAWREHTRELFEQAFSRGYTITDFVFSHRDVAAHYRLDMPGH